MSLRERCKKFVETASRNAILRQGSPTEDLMSFVQSEIGRAADASLEDTEALVLYFTTPEDRDDMVAAIHAAKPGMIAKRWPPRRA